MPFAIPECCLSLLSWWLAALLVKRTCLQRTMRCYQSLCGRAAKLLSLSVLQAQRCQLNQTHMPLHNNVMNRKVLSPASALNCDRPARLQPLLLPRGRQQLPGCT